MGQKELKGSDSDSDGMSVGDRLKKELNDIDEDRAKKRHKETQSTAGYTTVIRAKRRRGKGGDVIGAAPERKAGAPRDAWG